MKKINLAMILAAGLTLSACNAGTNTNGSDVQNVSASSANQYSLSITATNCRTISTTQSCLVNVTYSGSSTYSGLNLQLNNLTGYSNTLSSACPYQSQAASTSCSFYITTTGNTNVQNPTLSIGSTNASVQFVVGGGL